MRRTRRGCRRDVLHGRLRIGNDDGTKCRCAPALATITAARREKFAESIGHRCVEREVTCAKRRFGDENLSMVGLRFFGDPLVPDGRFETYRREFGEHFEAIELDPKTAAPGGFKRPHSVLTINLRDEGPTKAAEQRVIEFLRERTSVAPPNRHDVATP